MCPPMTRNICTSLKSYLMLSREFVYWRSVKQKHRQKGTKRKRMIIEDSLPVDNQQHEREATDGAESANETQLLKSGILAACFVPKYKEEEPQIGTIVSVPDKMERLK